MCLGNQEKSENSTQAPPRPGKVIYENLEIWQLGHVLAVAGALNPIRRDGTAIMGQPLRY